MAPVLAIGQGAQRLTSQGAPARNIFEAAFAAMGDAAAIMEPVEPGGEGGRDWRYVANNAAMQRLFGVGPLAGQTMRQTFPKDADEWNAAFDRVAESRAGETLIRRDDASQHIFEITLTPMECEARVAVLARVRDVTAEHAARQSRRDADIRYRTLFDAIDEGFCIIELDFDADGRGIDYRFLECNAAFVEQTGLADPVGKKIRELHPGIEEFWPLTYGEVAATGVPKRLESESAAFGAWYDVFAFPIGEAAPFLVGLLFEDATARKSMELALRHSENRLHSLICSTSDLIFRMDPDWTAMERLVGRGLSDKQEGAGESWLADHVHEQDRAKVSAAIELARAGREPLKVEHRTVQPDGTTGWLSVRAVPVLDDAGEIAEWFGMATDITSRKQAEQQLLHSAQMLRVASEIGGVGLWDWNLEDEALDWSDEHYRMEGFAAGEITPSYNIWADRVHPDDRALTESRIAQAMATGADYVNEYRVCHDDGDVRWLSARGRFLYDAKGNPVRMLGAMVDVTERRRQEEWQKLLVGELQHRVRNLISMVRSVVRQSASSHRRVDDYVDHLIGRLQAMGRTQGALTRAPGSKVDLVEIIREELLVHAARADQYAIEGPDVALSPHAAEIVTLAMHELATNSIKFGALGAKGHIRITWTVEHRGSVPWLALKWQETTAVRPTRSARRGFGRRLIEERIPYELQGEGAMQLHDTGILAEMAFPLVEGPSILETALRRARD